MNRPLPTIENERFYMQTDLAHACVQRLSRLRCQVEQVVLGGVRPVIWIRGDSAADKIPGALYKRETIRGRVHCTWVANVMGCQVRWKGDLLDPHPRGRRLPINDLQGVPA